MVTGHACVRTRKTRETARDVCFDATRRARRVRVTARHVLSRKCPQMERTSADYKRLLLSCAPRYVARAPSPPRAGGEGRVPPKLDPNLGDAPLTRRRQPWCRDRRTLRGCRRRSRRSRGPPPRPRRRCGGGRSARGCGGEPVARGGKESETVSVRALRMKTLAPARNATR